MKSFINIKVKNKEKNLRIDILLSNQDNKLSRSRVKSLILENKLKVNNFDGALARSRTLNLQSRNLALYPVELQAQIIII